MGDALSELLAVERLDTDSEDVAAELLAQVAEALGEAELADEELIGGGYLDADGQLFGYPGPA